MRLGRLALLGFLFGVAPLGLARAEPRPAPHQEIEEKIDEEIESEDTGSVAADAQERLADYYLDLYDVPESERDSQEAEDLVEDQLTLRERRERRLGLMSFRAVALPRPEWKASPPSQYRRTPWMALLPRLVLSASATAVPGTRHELRGMALADFSLKDTPRVLKHARADAGPWPDDMPVPRSAPEPTTPADTRDAGCLAAARQAAVSLAFVEPARARSYVERARRAAFLPELRIRVERRQGRKESLEYATNQSDLIPPLGLDTSNDVRYEARATWDLARLVFSNDELAAQSQALRMTDMRRNLESLVNKLFFERQRLRSERPSIEVAPSSATAEVELRRVLRIEEVEAELDSLSAGAFTTCASAVAREASTP